MSVVPIATILEDASRSHRADPEPALDGGYPRLVAFVRDEPIVGQFKTSLKAR